jgi:N-acetylneuraminic acid mutarotase
MHAAFRTRHTATLMPNGKVLVVGGVVPQDAVEIYDPVAMTWTRSPSPMTTARQGHTATLMPNGTVLVAGGQGVGGVGLREVETYNPWTDTWTPSSFPLGVPRADHTATLLPDGRVIFAGGVSPPLSPGAPNALVPTSGVERFDPETGSIGAAFAMSVERNRHTATWVPTGGPLGSIVVAGGQSPTSSPTVEFYDPVAGTWSSLPSPTRWSRHSATLEPNGKVLVVAGTEARELDPVSRTWAAPMAPLVARDDHTATLLESGAVLLAGTSADPARTQSAEFFRGRLPGTGHQWTQVAPMSAARTAHTATLLPDGTVLVAGGLAGSSTVNAPERYDPVANSWTPTENSMANGRWGHSATLLPNGKVLVAGGAGVSGLLATAETYDLVTRQWSTTGPMASPRTDHSATLLPDGRVLVAGGRGSGPLPQAELYDPGTGQWSSAGRLAFTRERHEATLLANGTVLISGGGSRDRNNALQPVLFAEIYDVSTGFNASTGATGTWTLANGPAEARYLHTATSSRTGGPLGSVFVAGGTPAGSTALASTFRFDATLTGGAAWTVAGSLKEARTGHAAAMLPTGKWLVAGGRGANGLRDSAEVFDPWQKKWSDTGRMGTPRQGHRATRLTNGQVLVTGGRDSSQAPLASSEIYTACAD